ncbi:MAG TPA: CrcB family protein [Cellulomonas sp.]|uniref:fluoride efflux transporter FluC n=1 Tax=Cellulomonas sp. TaxID=40001 RepID=UPI002E2FE1D3|nr:CrcB family protein [Cellulomonas sp.]HEX5333545.1 CrcB family protein [Cellulomonas sp.]
MRPAHHLNPRLVALVALGGMVGTTGRYLLSEALPSHGGWPVATFVANVVGSFLLGALLEALLRRGTENPRRRAVRLGLGTGVLGGFTTFSSLAIELERLLSHDALLTAATYAVSTLTCGLLACLLGVVVSARHDRRRRACGPDGAVRPASGGTDR